jgi:hypothetical protein
MNLSKNLRFLLLFVSGISVLTTIGFAQINGIFSGTMAVTSLDIALCGIIADIQLVVGLLAVVLIMLGGVLYAIAHFMPSAGNFKANAQSWALGMVIGAIVGLIIVIAAPGIVSEIAQFGGLSTTFSTTMCTSITSAI